MKDKRSKLPESLQDVDSVMERGQKVLAAWEKERRVIFKVWCVLEKEFWTDELSWFISSGGQLCFMDDDGDLVPVHPDLYQIVWCIDNGGS